MTSFRMAFSELRRLTATRLGKISLLALILVPTLYAGLYLYANHDPYGNLDRVPVALVVDDEPAALPDGSTIDVGERVATKLLDSGAFEWHRVSADDAADGVRDGTYDFALLIPRGFSAAFGATANFDPTQARLTMLTNDANSYLATTIATKVSDQVRQAISSEVSEEAATTFLTGLSSVRSQLITAAEGATQLNDGAATARGGAKKLANGADRLASGAEELADGLDTISAKVAGLPQQTRRLADGARQVADGDEKVAAVGRRAGTAADDILAAYRAGRSDLVAQLDALGITGQDRRAILGVYDDLGEPVRRGHRLVGGAVKDLNRLASGADRVADGAEQLADAIPALVDGIDEAHTGAGALADGADKLAAGAAELEQGLGDLHSGASRLADGLSSGVDQIPASDEATRQRLAETLGDPVAITNTSDAEADSYGAGLAPFFLALAAWIGGYVLFTQVRPLSRRAMAANQTPLRVALGGWMGPALLGLAQMVLALTVVSVAVGIAPANVPATLVFMMLTSVVFIAIVHALCAWFGLAGQFLGLVMMVLQLVTAGGTFPWQTIPPPLHVVHHLMPMSYALDGMRQLMYGGLDSRVWHDVLVLLVWLGLALLASSRAARRQRVWTPKSLAQSLAA